MHFKDLNEHRKLKPEDCQVADTSVLLERTRTGSFRIPKVKEVGGKNQWGGVCRECVTKW